MKNRIDIAPICNCKYYGVFAVNDKDPTDILGYVENSFSMGWSKQFVNLYPGYKRHKADIATENWFKDCEQNPDSAWNLDDIGFANWSKNCKFYVDGMTVIDMRKAYRDYIQKMHEAEFLAQNVWNYMLDGIHVPVGYTVKKFRIGAKCCPVEVDLRYRAAYDRKKEVKWDKWRYRNALFAVKAVNLDKGKPMHSSFPTLASALAVPASQLEDIKTFWYADRSMPASKFAQRTLKHITRSERKILKKQMKNTKKSNKANSKTKMSGNSIAATRMTQEC